MEWGFLLGWKGHDYPYPTWQRNIPSFREYPHVASTAIWLFEFAWHPRVLIAVIASGAWYYRVWAARQNRAVTALAE